MNCIRHLALTNAHNFRDLGGFPTKDKRCTKWGLLYRSDALSSLDKEEWGILQSLNVTLIIDLRSKTERDAADITPPDSITYRSFSLMKNLDSITEMKPSKSTDGEDATAKIINSMKLDYTETLFENLPCAVQILEEILDVLSNNQESVVFFCTAGKDRTGIIAALILYLCDVPNEDIIADYMISSTYNELGVNQMQQSFPQDLLDQIPDKDLLRRCFSSDPETMKALLDSFEKKDLRSQLEKNGFGSEKQKVLKDLFTEKYDE